MTVTRVAGNEEGEGVKEDDEDEEEEEEYKNENIEEKEEEFNNVLEEHDNEYGEEDVSSCSAAGVGLIEKACICMGAQDHVARSINNAVSWIGSYIVEKEMNCLFSGNCS